MRRSLTTTWCTRLLLPLGLAASVAGNALAQQPGVAPAWSVTNLGTLDGARTEFADFNNHGQVVGTAYPDYPDSPERRAFLYDAGRMTAIPPLPGLRFNEGLGINDRGQVIGSASDVGVHRGFLYSGGQLTPLVVPGSIPTRPVGINGRGDVLLGGDNNAGYIYSNGTYNNIGTLGGPSTSPSFINDRGQATGTSQLANGGYQSFFYSEGRMVPLATTGSAFFPSALNNAGQVAGSYSGSAAIFHEGQITSLGNLGGDQSGLADINDAGEAVGSIDYNPRLQYHEIHAFIFSDGQVQDLHTSFSYAGLQIFSSGAQDINELGQVLVAANFVNPGGMGFTGPRYFLWDDGRVTDLSAVLAEEGVSVGIFTGMLNDVGQIVFNGTSRDGVVTPYLITPIPEPSTYALMLAGLGTLAWIAWRKRGRSIGNRADQTHRTALAA